MIYRFRVILDHDSEEDIFRDIEIRQTDTLEDLHNVITQSFGFDGTEMASFYISNEEWEQGEEISLFDMSDLSQGNKLMSESILEDTVNKQQTKLIYVYDFFNMWTFLVELAEVVEASQGADYPNLMYVHGQVPTEAPSKTFESDSLFQDDIDDDFNIDDYDNLNFEENWN